MTRHPHPYRLSTVLAAAALTVTSCSATTGTASTSSTAATSSSSSSSSPPSSPSASQSQATPALPAGAKTLKVTVTGKKVTPAPASIDLKTGQTLRLIVTDNADNVFHAHGFDKEVNLMAGKPTIIDLVTNSPGKYEVETHHPELKLLTVLVRE